MPEFIEYNNNWINGNDLLSKEIPQIPGSVQVVLNLWKSIIDFLLAILDFMLIALDILKSFMIGLIDPIVAIIEEILSQIEDYIMDLRNVGVYITSDVPIMKPPFTDILGGFQAFENRMIRRLIDKSDPTRPVFSENTAVFSVFMYYSVQKLLPDAASGIADALDGEEGEEEEGEEEEGEEEEGEEEERSETVNYLIGLLNQFYTIFGIQNEEQVNSFLTPVDVRASFFDTVEDKILGVINPNAIMLSTSPPRSVMLNWNMSSYSSSQKYSSFQNDPPHGFIIEVSTVKDGLGLFYERYNGDGSLSSSGMVVDPNNNKYFLYGGYDSISDSVGYNTPGSGVVSVFLRKDINSTKIPVDLLKQDDKYMLQRSFFIKTSDMYEVALSPRFVEKKGYTFDFNADDLPYDCEFKDSGGVIEIVEDSIKIPSTVYVRIYAVSDKINRAEDSYLRFGITKIDNKPLQLIIGEGSSGISFGDRGPVSEPIEVTMPSITANLMVQMIMASLSVLVLSRSDVEVWGSGDKEGKSNKKTGLESYGSLISTILDENDVNSYYSKYDQESGDDIDFRNNLYNGVVVLANKLYSDIGGNQDLESMIIEKYGDILNWKWSDSLDTIKSQGDTISIDDDDNVYYLDNTILGSLKYPYSFNRKPVLLNNIQYSIGSRSPGFFSINSNYGSVDDSPSFLLTKSDRNKVNIFCRNMFSKEIYEMARSILSVSASKETKSQDDGEWLVLKLGNVLPFEPYLLSAVDFLRGILVGSPSSVVDVIVTMIEFLENKVKEIQEFIERLDALISMFILVKIPIGSIMMGYSLGTDQLLGNLIGADNKPIDGEDFYGAGAAIVFSGVPSMVVDILIGVFGG